MLTEGIGAQVPADAHLTFDPVILFGVTFPDPAGMAPIQVTAQGPRAFLKTAPKQSIHSPLPLPYLSISHTNLYLIHWACRSDGRPTADRAMPRKSEPSRQWSAFVVAAVDLDAPRPQALFLSQVVLHFLGGGFYLDVAHGSQHGSPSLTKNISLVNDTPAIIEFLRPGPPKGSDPHR